MVKLTALYKKPNDPAQFDQHYKEIHMPLASKIPGLTKTEVAKIIGSPTGESDYYLMANMYFANLEALKAGMGSEEGKAAAKDLKNFANGILQMMICEVQ